MIKKILKYSAVILIWLCIWQVGAMAVGKELLLPYPIKVFARIGKLCLTSELYKTIGISFLRIFTGMIIGTVLGILGGIATAFSKLAKAFFAPMLAVFKSAPIASFIILLLLWLSRDIVPIVIAVLIVLPVVWSNVEMGIRSSDKDLLEMSKAYKMTPAAKARYIYFPTVMPYFIASLRSSLGMSWKAGIAAEALILPLVAIGTQIYESKYNLETVDLFAWTVIVIILSVLIEGSFIALLKKTSAKYMRNTGGGAVDRI